MPKDRRPEQLNSRSYLRFQLFAWGFLGGYMLIVNPYFWKWWTITLELGKIVVLALISHSLVKIAESREWFDGGRTRLLFRGLAASVFGGLVPTLIFHPIAKAGFDKSDSFEPMWFTMDYVSNVAILAMWEGFFSAFYFHELNSRSALDRIRLRATSKELQLSTLRSQLNPHFLFNSFNLLRSLVQRDPETARDSITHLAEMMRHLLSYAAQNTISLAKELEFVESYLFLERLRYEDRLRISSKVPDELRIQTIPAMLLHTFVENAVKYGIDQSRGGVDVSYEVGLESGSLWLRVINSGVMVKGGNSAGTGLTNVRSRLELLYGAEASVNVFERNQQVVAEARWPAVPPEDIAT